MWYTSNAATFAASAAIMSTLLYAESIGALGADTNMPMAITVAALGLSMILTSGFIMWTCARSLGSLIASTIASSKSTTVLVAAVAVLLGFGRYREAGGATLLLVMWAITLVAVPFVARRVLPGAWYAKFA
jgi:hypothetical protein